MWVAEILCDSRKQLMLSYIFAYFVEAHMQKEIFEMNQTDLQLAIEKLSMCFDNEITNDNAMAIVEDVSVKARWVLITKLCVKLLDLVLNWWICNYILY